MAIIARREVESLVAEDVMPSSSAGAFTSLGSPSFQTPYWNRHRLELVAWFDERAPHLTELYKAGVNLLMAEGFPGRATLIAHTVREVGNRLPNVIGISRETTAHRLQALVKTWKECGLATDFSVPLVESLPGSAGPTTFPMPMPAMQAIATLLRSHVGQEAGALDNAIALLREISPGSGHSIEQLRPVAFRWVEVMRWFQARAHASNEPRMVPNEELIQKFETFETLLGSMLRPFFSTLKDVDEILEEANS